MYKISTATQFADSNLIYLPECHSTNEVMSEMSARGLLQEGDIVITDHQYAGKGQHERSWLSAPGKNLTFSVFFQPRHLTPDKNFILNIVITLAITDWLESIQPGKFKIKWPNDIVYADDIVLADNMVRMGNKIGGILIRNQVGSGKIKWSVAGIGLNVNQMDFPEELDNAVSLRMTTGKNFDLNRVFNGLLERLDFRYRQSIELNPEKLKTEYLEYLFGINKPLKFQTENEVITGIIRDVDVNGRLIMEVGNQQLHFMNGEVRFLPQD